VRTDVLPALFKCGDIEGQYSIYVDWQQRTRYVTTKVKRGAEVQGMQVPQEAAGDDDEIEDIEEEAVEDFGPRIEVILDNDLLIQPMIADSVDEALYLYGGQVTLLRRWSEAMIRAKMAEGEIDDDMGEELIQRMKGTKEATRRDEKKSMVDAAGVKGAGKYVLVYEVWKVLKVNDERKLCRTYYGGSDLILSSRLNPFWCDLCPIISVPADKIAGSAKGISRVASVKRLQYLANDYLNQGADSANYALMPIIATDPISNPRVGSMVVDLGAVWEVDPTKTKFMEFPHLWRDSLEIIQSLTTQIFQTLSVNPSMISQRNQSKKPTQAEIAAEQQIDILATADVIVPFEQGVLTPMVQRIVAYDAQFRDQPLWVKAFGRDGIKSQMQEVPPQQQGKKVWFRWFGSEKARSAQERQQQISFMNVLQQIPPDKLHGRVIDMVPLIERAVEDLFGPTLGPQIFKPMSDMIGMDPMEENQLLLAGNDLPVAPTDDDRKHLMAHQQALSQANTPHAQWAIKQHMFKHQQQMAMKNQAHAEAAQQGGGGGPKPGAQVKGPQGKAKSPPGAVSPRQMPLSVQTARGM
jgi:hypothetical protein